MDLRLVVACSVVALAPCWADSLPRRGMVGVQLAPAEGLQRGALVRGVIPGSAAEAAGILAGDIAVGIDEAKVENPGDFVGVMAHHIGGDTVSVRLLRDGKPVVKTLTLKPRPYATAPDFDVRYDSVVVDGSRRRVILTVPRTPGPHPAVLYVGGIGCYSTDAQDPADGTLQLLYPLTRAGFITMRVEKTGMGDSEGAPCTSPEADLTAEVRGYVAGLRMLRTYATVDPKRLSLFGHSIGTIVAPLVGEQVPVSAMVLAEGVGTAWFEYELTNRRRVMRLEDRSYTDIDAEVHLQEICKHRLYFGGQTPEQIVKETPACSAIPMNSPAPYTYERQVAQLHLADLWKATGVPVLTVYGTSDPVTSAAENRLIADVINSYHPGMARFVEIAGMDHFLMQAASQQEGLQRMIGNVEPGSISEAFLKTVIDWLHEKTAA